MGSLYTNTFFDGLNITDWYLVCDQAEDRRIGEPLLE